MNESGRSFGHLSLIRKGCLGEGSEERACTEGKWRTGARKQFASAASALECRRADLKQESLTGVGRCGHHGKPMARGPDKGWPVQQSYTPVLSNPHAIERQRWQ